MDRRAVLLEGLDLSNTRGLEIGPLHNPILRRPEADVLYVDHVDTASLREKYRDDADVPAGGIVEVDIVWSGGSLLAACDERRFDYVVASHVIEHVPDLVGWLEQIRSVVYRNGTVRLIVPDLRYCFDYRRQSSSVADMILARDDAAVIPGPRQILDFMLNIAPRDFNAVWSGDTDHEPAPEQAEYDRAIAVMQHAAATGAYHDVHCWAFTPLSFARLMRQLAAYGLLGFACTRCTATAPDSLDFFVHLMSTDDDRLIAETWRWAVQHQAGERPNGDALLRLRHEISAMRRSRSWRLTAPLRRLGTLLRPR